MRILLLVSAFNGLSQRAWCALREAGHDVGVQLAGRPQDIVGAVRAARPDLIICPYLTERVPSQVWSNWRTVIIHPGPVGDRGRSSLDWAIAEGAPFWGVTALQAVEELDAGPIWATRTFPMPAAPPRKSAFYLGPVADAAMECIFETVEKAANPAFTPTPATEMTIEVHGARPRPAMRQRDRQFDWDAPTEHIVRRLRASDGSPGVRTEVGGLEVFAYDAHPGHPGDGSARNARPGALLSRRQGAVLVGTGDGAVWLGHLRAAEPHGTEPHNAPSTDAAPADAAPADAAPADAAPADAAPADLAGSDRAAVKLPATTLLGDRLRGVPNSPLAPGIEPEPASYRQIRYRRRGPVGWLAFDFYNGAMSVGHCRRLLAALRHAAAQDTRALVLRGGTEVFSNGIHLNVIEAAAGPAGAAWANIKAINQVCREIITCARQVVIAAYAGSAGAGGAMLGLGADIVAARSGIILNPYYDIGLYGAELHTFVLPRRVGPDAAQRLVDDRLPVSAGRAKSLGLVDEVGPRHPEAYTLWLTELAERHADARTSRAKRAAKAKRLAAEPVPLDAYEAQELAEMSRDVFADRSGFAAARRAFVTKAKATGTPARLAFPREEDEPARVAHIGRQFGRLRPAFPVSA